MAKYTVQTWTDGVSALSAARMTVLENGIREASMGRSTTFPSSPVDGDIHVYPADTTNGVMWHFMYRSAPNDWEFIGGAPLFAEVVTDEATTSTASVRSDGVAGRIEIDDVAPVVSTGRYPAKAVVGEIVPIRATVWREGHDAGCLHAAVSPFNEYRERKSLILQ